MKKTKNTSPQNRNSQSQFSDLLYLIPVYGAVKYFKDDIHSSITNFAVGLYHSAWLLYGLEAIKPGLVEKLMN